MQKLLAKYGKITPLRGDEEEVFRGFASRKREFAPGTTLLSNEIDEPDQLFIIDSGRLFASSDLPNGERAITRLYFAGDIVGTANIPFEHATQSITVQTPSVLYIFPRAKLIEAFTTMPRIAAIFYTFAALEGAILNDRLVSVGRTRGRSRIAALILEIWSRRNLTLADPEVSFRLGLTQAQIGDAVGLTEVQVNRLFRTMDEEHLIERSGEMLRILDHNRLCEIGQFRDRYDDLDLNWFKDEF